MTLFKKKDTIAQNIAFMAIMAAINVIFVLLTALLPPLMFLIVFVLPLTSTVVTLFCKKRLFPIYFLVTIGLCLLVTSGIYIFDTFFYVIPSLITGLIFGILVERKIPSIYIILISNIVQFVLMYLTFFIMGLIITNISFIDILLSMFGLSDFIYKSEFIAVFLFSLASIQTAFTYIFTKFSIKKLGFEFNLEIDNFQIPLLITFLCLVISIAALFFYVPLTFIAIMFLIPLAIYEIVFVVLNRNRLLLALLVISVFVEALLFALFYKLFPHPTGVIMIAPIYAFISCIYFANNLFNKKTKEDKIDS